jgi:hypothetical protein
VHAFLQEQVSSSGSWGEVFNDQILATAILDRLLHHATTVNIKGDSYRLREKKKAGLLGRKPKPAGDLSRRWESSHKAATDTNVGEQGTSYFGVFRTTEFGLDKAVHQAGYAAIRGALP